MPHNTDDSPLGPVGFLLASRNLYALVALAQFILIVNGEYLYQISFQAAIMYFTAPILLILYLLKMTKMDNGQSMTMEYLERSVMPRRDLLTAYLRQKYRSVQYFSLGVQLIYFSLAFSTAYVIFLGMAMQGWLSPGILSAEGARSAIVMTLILVAPSETLIFHVITPIWVENTFKKSQYCLWLTYGLSQAIFAVAHYAAYGGQLPAMAFAWAFGMCLLFAVRSWGIPAGVGIHAAWNLIILGVGSSALAGV